MFSIKSLFKCKSSCSISKENEASNSCSLPCEKTCSKKKCCIFTILYIFISFIVSSVVLFTLGNVAFKRFLQKNPKVIISSVENMYKQEQENMQKTAESNAGKVLAKILENPNIPFHGSKDAKKVVLYFYDYACHHCKTEDKELAKLAENKDIKIVYVDFPIFSSASYIAAKIGVYFFKNDVTKFLNYHKNLMLAKTLDKNTIEGTLKALGIKDTKSFIESVIKDESSKLILEQNHASASELQLQGTPALIVSNLDLKSVKFIPGFADYVTIKSYLDK